MAFATSGDVSNRLGRTLTPGETTTVDALIEGATAVIAEAVDRDDDWAAALDPVPKIVKVMTVELVCRALANPNQLAALSETLGSFQYSARFRDAGILLTEVEERLVRKAVHGRLSGSAPTQSIVADIYGS